jgi:hypothetical protein
MRPPKIEPTSPPPPAAYARAFARLNAAVAQATTPSDMTLRDKLRQIRLRVFGRIAEEQPQPQPQPQPKHN